MVMSNVLADGDVSVQTEMEPLLLPTASLGFVRTNVNLPGAAPMPLPSVAVQFWAKVKGRVRRRVVDREEMVLVRYMVVGN